MRDIELSDEELLSIYQIRKRDIDFIHEAIAGRLKDVRLIEIQSEHLCFLLKRCLHVLIHQDISQKEKEQLIRSIQEAVNHL